MKVLVFLIGLLAWTAASAAELLSNQQVIQMTQLDLGDQIVIAKIESADVAFDVAPEALSELKKAGVSDAVLAAMIRAQSGARGVAPATAASAAGAIGPEEMHLGRDEGAQALVAVKVTSQHSNRKAWVPFNSGNSEQFFFIEGASSSQVFDGSPRFISRVPPDRLRLVRLGHHRRSGDRFVVFSGSRSDRDIQLQAKSLEAGLYELSVAAPLQPDEYAILVAPDLQQSSPSAGPAAGLMAVAMANFVVFNAAYDFKVAH